MCRHLLLVTLACLGAALLPTLGAAGSKRSVTDLIAELKKGEKELLQAIQELEALGGKAAEAAPALVGVFGSKNEDVRLHAALALGKIGEPAVAPLTKALANGKDEDVRFYAVWSLAFIGPPAKGATAAVAKALSDPSAQVRRKAAYALGRIDADPKAAVDGLVGALADSDNDVRQAAVEALPKLGKTAVPALVKALQSDKAALRNQAIATLGAIGADAEEAIPQLKAFLLAPDKGAAQPAADALAGIGAPAIKTLTAAAADENQTVRSHAVNALQKVGTPAVPTLVDLLGSKHVDVRRQAATALGQVPVNEKVVIVGLGFAAAKDKDFQVRRTALQSLRNRGVGAKLAEPYIIELMTDIDPDLRQEAFHTLQGLGVDPRPGLKKALAAGDLGVRIKTASLMAAMNFEVELAIPVLREALKQKDEALKMQAATSLASRGLEADEVLPIFIAGLKNEVPSVRRQAAAAIAPYGAKASAASKALIAALDDADDSVSAQALATLRQVGTDAKTLFPAMIGVLRRTDEKQQFVAAQIIYQVGPSALPEIIALLKNEKAPGVRLVCLQTLAMVGPPAKAAVPELTKALGDGNVRARMAAARALGNIGPDAKPALDALTKAEKDDSDGNVRSIAKAAASQINGAAQKDFEIQGILTNIDPYDQVRQGHYHVVHTFLMKAGQTYTIDLRSPWDNYLRLESPTGQQLAQDDDGGGFPNARITHRAATDGWHRIIVTSFAPGAGGAYTLKVK